MTKKKFVVENGSGFHRTTSVRQEGTEETRFTATVKRVTEGMIAAFLQIRRSASDGKNQKMCKRREKHDRERRGREVEREGVVEEQQRRPGPAAGKNEK